MSVRLGSTEVSFRLGSITPTKVAIGSAEVWTDVVPTVPGIPTGLTVTTSETEESSVDVEWTAPESDGDSPITVYKVYRSFNSYDYTLHATVSGTATAVTVAYSGGQTIYIRVSAVNAVGEGTEGEPTTGTMSDSAPGAPEGVSMAVTGVKAVTLYWSPPTVDGGESITGYEISYYIGASETEYFETVGAEVTDYTFTDANSGVQYQARVAATNSIGTGPYTALSSIFTADAPGLPSFMFASASGSAAGAITFDFTSASDGGSPITEYELEYDTDNTFSAATLEPLPAEVGSYSILNLQGGAAYYLRLRAGNAAGKGDWVVYGGNPVTASPTVPGVPADFSVSPDYENEEWDATWTEPSDGGDTITSYEIEEIDQDFFGTPTTASLLGTGTAVSWAVEDPDQTRKFRIRAVNAVGNGEWSEYVESYYDTPTVPGAPTITSATYGGGQTTVAFTDPEDNGNAAITGYTFYFDSSAQTPDSTGAGTVYFNYDYRTYNVTMTATNSVGEGPASTAVTVTDG